MLSAEQLEYAARIGEFWERRVLSTERCDRHDVRYLVDRVYQAFGFSPPSTVTRVDSPVAGIAHVMRLAADHRHLGPHMGKDLRDDLDDQLERMLLDEGSRTLDERIWRALGARARLGQGTELDQPMWRPDRPATRRRRRRPQGRPAGRPLGLLVLLRAERLVG
ncbi:hypothetical protein GOARA_013_00020 [Gordonia araii NBRC 100433]|uniref:Uncharacterized protein n=1 Tax=Gordonia araii NBRC 100433 TaxID=1073574 RepID=G7GY83_9ACTN|nr:hypothetical protein [Gordonia araii]NNG97443.1 hypothetical protein [Gordonia araii NBRC 100433]GAB08558.1 hypothetical protein GOARA_013_00020 [Gordonia araii NBRC 100433]